MRIFISVDMEGITGVASRLACKSDGVGPEYGRFRKLMTNDVNAAIEGAVSAGVDEVIVGDGHGWMNNVLIENLHEKARLISGSNKLLCQMGGIEDYKFDGVFFIGYHGHEGSQGIVNHTIMGASVTQITVNGKVVGETTINAGIAGHYGLPVALVTGDDIVTAEAKENLGNPELVIVKRAKDRFVADCLPPKVTEVMIRDGAKRAVERLASLKPYQVKCPVTLEVTFKTTPEAAMCALFPTVEIINSKTVRITAQDYITGFKQLWGCLILGNSVQGGIFS